MEEEFRRITIHGRVHGVGYRAAAQRTARELGIRGTVRNLTDGRVQIEAAGAPAAMETLIAWCRRGPALSRVDHVEVENCATVSHSSFDVIR